MNTLELKKLQLERRKTRVRKRVYGTAERPRLTVTRSLKNIYAQLVDDDRGVTLCAASTRDKDLRSQIGYGGNKSAAAVVGKALAERAIAQGVSAVCFDRNGRRYHGRIKVLADAARECGLKF